ncbi:MAG TPA: 5-formyltetrahydrofolate cyclo-ligase [Casimicrobiaceae bacterium]|nr:5-formyltetrahydrofolate cyclo-ligase [Casimicrobiaceae bacterium]
MSGDSPAEPRPDPRDAKRRLRERVLRSRDALSAQARASFGDAIRATLEAREDFRIARTVLLSLAFRSEWETRPLFAAARALGKTAVAPRVERASRMLELRAVADLERDVAPGYLGISEPLPHCLRIEPSAIDWVLVPGVAFDLHGHRIGYGGGYYDRLLPTLRADARRVAGAFELQLVESVPAAAHDLKVDAIVTEARTIVPRP